MKIQSIIKNRIGMPTIKPTPYNGIRKFAFLGNRTPFLPIVYCLLYWAICGIAAFSKSRPLQ